MTEINPRFVDGEPMCKECPWCDQVTDIYKVLVCTYTQLPAPISGPCIPGLRRQRDEARRELCELLGASGFGQNGCANVAASRGWSYLYNAALAAKGE